MQPNIINCKRLLGKPNSHKDSSKPPPLLVILGDQQQAEYILSSARKLRDSSDGYTQAHIFINAHLTRGEAQAAYEARCRRRNNQAAATAAKCQQSTGVELSKKQSRDLPEPTDADKHNLKPLNRKFQPTPFVKHPVNASSKCTCTHSKATSCGYK